MVMIEGEEVKFRISKEDKHYTVNMHFKDGYVYNISESDNYKSRKYAKKDISSIEELFRQNPHLCFCTPDTMGFRGLGNFEIDGEPFDSLRELIRYLETGTRYTDGEDDALLEEWEDCNPPVGLGAILPGSWKVKK